MELEGSGDCGGKCVFIHVCKVDLKCAMCGWVCEARAQSREHRLHHYLSNSLVVNGVA